MGGLATFLGSALGGLATWLGTFLGKKAAVVAASLTVFVGLLSVFWVAIKGLSALLVVSFPSGGMAHYLVVGMNLFLPDNFELCVSTMLAADVLAYLYKRQLENIAKPAAGS